MLLYIINELHDLSTTFSTIEDLNGQDLISLKKRIEASIIKTKTHSSEKSKITELLASLEQLIAKVDSAHRSTPPSDAS